MTSHNRNPPQEIDVNLVTKEYISSAIFFIKQCIKDQRTNLNSIVGSVSSPSPLLSTLNADTLSMLQRFEFEFNSNIEGYLKNSGKAINANLKKMLKEASRIKQESYQPPQLTPLAYSSSSHPLSEPVTPKRTTSLPKSTSLTPSALYAGSSPYTGGVRNANGTREVDNSCDMCPFCERVNLPSREALLRHIQDDHPKDCDVYEKISSLTPEFMLASEAPVSGNRQCWYCSVQFRSNAPLFRHIQEKHVNFFDIFIKISLCKGDNIQSVKSSTLNLSNRANPAVCSLPANNQQQQTPKQQRQQQVMKPSTATFSQLNSPHSPVVSKGTPNSPRTSVLNGSPVITTVNSPTCHKNQQTLSRVNNETSAISTLPKNARKSIKCSTGIRCGAAISELPVPHSHTPVNNFNPAGSSSVTVACTSKQTTTLSPAKSPYQAIPPSSTVNPAAIPLEANEKAHSARKRRQTTPQSPQPVRRNRRSRYSEDPERVCTRCNQLFKTPDERKRHTPHCPDGSCDKLVDERVANKSPRMVLGKVTQSEIISSPIVSSSSTECCSVTSDPGSSSPSDQSERRDFNLNLTEAPETDPVLLARSLREVQVFLPNIDQEDLVICMRGPNFKLVQELV